MVNVGGPSKGCRTCISRKIRCDRQLPACGQCQRSSRECGGYRDATDIMFRNQSEIVIAKAAANSKKQSRSLKESKLPTKIGVRAVQEAQSSPNVIAAPKIHEEHGLITFFANNFTSSDDANSRSNLFWVPKNFDELLKDPSASLTVQCVGAMALARLRRSPYYLHEAQKKYGEAILGLTKTWQQESVVNSDATVIAVHFLGFFEVLACYDSSSRQSWVTHLTGVGSIFAERRRQSMATRFGARMLLQSRSQVIVNALLTKTPVPAEFTSRTQVIRQVMPQDFKPFDDLDTLLIRLASLQAAAQAATSLGTLWLELKVLHTDLCHWADTVPISWSFSTQPRKSQSGLWWDTRCDVYSRPIIAHAWNKYRTARIVTHDLMLIVSSYSSPSAASSGSLSMQSDQRSPSHETRELVTEICATVPMYYRPRVAPNLPDGDEDRPLLGTTYWLFWSLGVIASMIEAPKDLTVWVRLCLERIHETTGIEVARKVANRLSMGGQLSIGP